MKRPEVIDPPNFTFHDDDDPGVCSCPTCGAFYELAGRVIRCECGFSFPTDWWPQYSRGCQDGMRVLAGAEVSGGMRRRSAHHPYYRRGFNLPAEDPWKVKGFVDWKSVVGPMQSLRSLREYSYCGRCGNDKTDGRENRSGLCQLCEAETTCKHLTRELRNVGPGYDYVCYEAVSVKELVGDSPGWATRLPCRYWEGGCPVQCDKFEPVGIDAVRIRDDKCSVGRTLATLSVMSAIKEEHKGKNWRGVVECPVCGGQLHVSHAAYNGSVHGLCRTKDCVSWME